MNNQNLVVPTSEAARKNGRKGGLKSVKVRREKKAMKEYVLAILESKADGQTITRQEEILLAQYEKALKGDTRACEFLRDTSGQKPKDSVEVSGEIGIIDILTAGRERVKQAGFNSYTLNNDKV